MGDPVPMTVMIASAVVAVMCCVGSGRAVPWQGRQSVIVMAGAMIGMVAAAGDPRVALLAGIALIGSAMLGTAGLRGRPTVGACCHRALGSLVMALCAFAEIAHGAVVEQPGHGAHFATDAVGGLATLGVALFAAWTIVDRCRPQVRRGCSRLLAAESWAMTIGVIVMWAAH